MAFLFIDYLRESMTGLILLDRDGTINVDSGYVCKPEEVVLIPDAAKAIGDMKRASYAVVIVTNQSAIGRGMATAKDVESCNEQLQKLLLEQDSDAVIDQVVYCPAHPDEVSLCRKPNIGMISMLKAELKALVSSNHTWMLGDKSSDIEFGINAGLSQENCILVLTGEGEKTRLKMPDSQRVFANIFDFSTELLQSA